MDGEVIDSHILLDAIAKLVAPMNINRMARFVFGIHAIQSLEHFTYCLKLTQFQRLIH